MQVNECQASIKKNTGGSSSLLEESMVDFFPHDEVVSIGQQAYCALTALLQHLVLWLSGECVRNLTAFKIASWRFEQNLFFSESVPTKKLLKRKDGNKYHQIDLLGILMNT